MSLCATQKSQPTTNTKVSERFQLACRLATKIVITTITPDFRISVFGTFSQEIEARNLSNSKNVVFGSGKAQRTKHRISEIWVLSGHWNQYTVFSYEFLYQTITPDSWFKKAGGEPGVSGDSIIPISRLVLGRNELHGTSRMNSSCSHGRMFLCRWNASKSTWKQTW